MMGLFLVSFIQIVHLFSIFLLIRPSSPPLSSTILAHMLQSLVLFAIIQPFDETLTLASFIPSACLLTFITPAMSLCLESFSPFYCLSLTTFFLLINPVIYFFLLIFPSLRLFYLFSFSISLLLLLLNSFFYLY